MIPSFNSSSSLGTANDGKKAGCNTERDSDRTKGFSLPFPLYDTQAEFLQQINRVLFSGNDEVLPEGEGGETVPILAAEVPTGCGKTLVLLVALLNFVYYVKKLHDRSSVESAMFLARGSYWGNSPLLQNSNICAEQEETTAAKCEEENVEKDNNLFNNSPEEWSSLPLNFAQSLAAAMNPTTSNSSGARKNGGGSSAKASGHKIKNTKFFFSSSTDGREGYEFLADMRREHAHPVVSVFYATRTHSQIKQVIGELEKVVPDCSNNNLSGNNNYIKMNVMGSRNRLCIQRSIVRGQQSGEASGPALENNNNNLGEMCDKLVSLNMCPFVFQYAQLMYLALNGAIPRARGGGGGSCGSSCTCPGSAEAGARDAKSQTARPYFDNTFDIEDLVREGQQKHCCPYYASRDLLYYSDIVFCSYSYLLDPIIRHEAKIEKSLRTRIPKLDDLKRCKKSKKLKSQLANLHASVIVFDEGHHVADYCRDSLSTVPNSSVLVLLLILKELLPLMPVSSASSTTSSSSSPASSTSFVLHYPRQLQLNRFFTLSDVFLFLFLLFSTFLDYLLALPSASGTRPEGEPYVSGPALSAVLQDAFSKFMIDKEKALFAGSASGSSSGGPPQSYSAVMWVSLFKYAYSIVFSLGVTFNPFSLSIFALSQMKKLLLIFRFLLQKPEAFAIHVKRVEYGDDKSSSSSSSSDAELYRDWCHVKQAVEQVESDRNLRRDGGETAFEQFLFARYSSFFHLSDAPNAYSMQNAPAGRLGLLCFDIKCLDGSLAFHYLIKNNVHRVIIASGTLAPFSELLLKELHLGLPAHGQDGGSVPCRIYEGAHVVPFSQYKVFCVSEMTSARGNGGSVAVRCTHQNLSEDNFVSGLVSVIIRYIVGVFGDETPRSGERRGVLVFLPNYSVLGRMYQSAVEQVSLGGKGVLGNGILLFAEQRNGRQMDVTLETYRRTLAGKEGGSGVRVCVFFAVYRGKLSEGINFVQNMSRVIVNVGVPFLNCFQWDIRALRQFYTPQQQQQQQQRCVDWYTADAIRAVNQSSGRLLRNREDYGVILLLDERYSTADDASESMYARYLSRWCRQSLAAHSGRGGGGDVDSIAVPESRRFFAEMGRAAGGRPQLPERRPRSRSNSGSRSGSPRRGGECETRETPAVLGSEYMPFQYHHHRRKMARGEHAHTSNSDEAARVCLRSTARKLLHEESDEGDKGGVTPHVLDAAVDTLLATITDK